MEDDIMFITPREVSKGLYIKHEKEFSYFCGYLTTLVNIGSFSHFFNDTFL